MAKACMCDHCAREATCEVGSVCNATIDRSKWQTVQPRSFEVRDGKEVCTGTMYPVDSFAPANAKWLRDKVRR
jgi:hypothetical protein